LILSVEDDLGRVVALSRPALRVVSLVPSLTELAHELGAEVVGCTRYCVRPPGLRERAVRIGGTKDVKSREILALKPDLVLANREENEAGPVTALMEQVPVYVSEVSGLADQERLLHNMGLLLGQGRKAAALWQQQQGQFEAWRDHPLRRALERSDAPGRRSLYLIWRKPWMGAGADTFIHAMMEQAGLGNALAGQSRYPALDEDALRNLQPDLILLSSEPYPFRERHRAELQALCPQAHILLVDGEVFSWYGYRPLFAPVEWQRIAAQLLP
jgi:ABC-type Fe3+-hydroxamate transport system substrate-binding protein